jgi:hypothetical protein
MIARFLKWALSKFEPKPTLKEKLDAWPFPAVSEDFDPRPEPKKTKPRVAKATTRKPAAKKPAVAVKTVRTKKAK